MTATTHDNTEILGSVRRTHGLLLVLAGGAAALFLEDVGVIGGVVAGGILGLVNFEALRWLGRRILDAEQRSRTFYSMLFLAKMTLVFAAVWLVLSLLPIDPLGFLVGFSLLLPAIGLMGLRQALAPTATDEAGGR